MEKKYLHLGQKISRNRLSLTMELNLNDPDAKELFLTLSKKLIFFMESMVWMEKLGFYDEELMKANPQLVIAHVSGFARKEFGGYSNYNYRAFYDMVGQTFSGWLYLNGEPGQGQVVDIAQFEAQAKVMSYTYASYTMTGTIRERTGNKTTAPFNLMGCSNLKRILTYL